MNTRIGILFQCSTYFIINRFFSSKKNSLVSSSPNYGSNLESYSRLIKIPTQFIEYGMFSVCSIVIGNASGFLEKLTIEVMKVYFDVKRQNYINQYNGKLYPILRTLRISSLSAEHIQVFFQNDYYRKDYFLVNVPNSETR